MLAGRCRCGAGKFLSCGCAGAREDEPSAKDWEQAAPGPTGNSTWWHWDVTRRDALGPETLLVLCLGTMRVGLS